MPTHTPHTTQHQWQWKKILGFDRYNIYIGNSLLVYYLYVLIFVVNWKKVKKKWKMEKKKIYGLLDVLMVFTCYFV